MGAFDDLIPQGGAAGAGMFDDLIPGGAAGLPGGAWKPLPGFELGGAPKPVKPAQPEMAWGEVLPKAIANVPSSAAQFVHPFLHPIETAENLGAVARGVYEKATGREGEYAPYAEAAWQGLVDRYGGVENLKRTLATDPIGAMGDLSMLLTGGGSAAARIPGVAGRLTEAASTLGRVANPVEWPAGLARGAGELASRVADVEIGAGVRPIQEAFSAGVEGGEAARALRENMRGRVPMADVVDRAAAGVEEFGRQRNAQYIADMAATNANPVPIDMQPIRDAVRAAMDINTFQGVPLAPSTARVQNQIMREAMLWELRGQQNPVFHTPAGLDAFKKLIGNIRDAQPFHTPERKLATDVYRAVRQEIVNASPDYAQAMRGYEEASDLLDQLRRELSLGPRGNPATALRKLQSVMRDNVNTSWGHRAGLVEALQEGTAAGENLMPALAGQALHAWEPRGLARTVAGGVGLTGLTLAPHMLASLPLTSPRLMGETAYLGGRVLSPAVRLGRGLAPAAPYMPLLSEIGRTVQQ